MAKRIKGITIEIDGETTGLQESLKDVDKVSGKINTELRDINRSLKFNPNSVELLAQKQELLSDQIVNTSERLDKLKSAQEEVERQFSSGEIDNGQYRAFQRELVETESKLNHYQNSLKDIETEQNAVEDSTRQLNKIFELTDTTVDDFADSLGSRLTNALRDGKANSSQLETALSKIGTETLGTRTDINKLKTSLDSLDDGSSLDTLKKDLNLVETEATEAERSVDGLGDAVEGIAGALTAGAGLSGIVEQAQELSSLDTSIDVAFNISDESTEVVKESIRTIEAYGVDTEEALEGARRQWALNADASDEANQAIVEGAGAISRAYAGIDFTEMIQETNEIASELGITNEEALALTNSLLKVGFPPEEIDTIAEYGRQLTEAGYTAEEVQALMSAGVDTGTWNIDNLLDGLKEGRILVGEFGAGIDDATAEMLEGTNISTEQLQTWGQEVSAGGEAGKKALQEVAQALVDVEDGTKRNELGVKFFGTMWEDQGENITDTILNMNDHLVDSSENQEDLNATIEKLDSDPFVQMQKALRELKTALEPLMRTIGDFVGRVAEWIQQNPELAATITAVAVTLGTILGVITALGAAITFITPIFTALGGVIAGISWPIVLIVGLIGSAIAIIMNWGTVWQWLQDTVGPIVSNLLSFVSNLASGVGTWFSNMATTVATHASAMWTSISTYFTNIVTKILTSVTTAYNNLQTWFNNMLTSVSTILGNILNKVNEIWNNIVSAITEKAGAVADAANTVMQAGWDAVSAWVSNFLQAGRNIVDNIAQGIRNGIGNVKDSISSVAQTVRNYLPFSPAKEGPLRDIHRLNFGGTIADSIDRDAYKPVRSIGNMASELVKTLQSVPSSFNLSHLSIPTLADIPSQLGVAGNGSLFSETLLRDIDSKLNVASSGNSPVVVNFHGAVVREDNDIQLIAEEVDRIIGQRVKDKKRGVRR